MTPTPLGASRPARIDGVWKQPWGVNDLDHRDRTGWLYAPGTGLTVATSPTGGTLFAHSSEQATHLTLTGAPAETQALITTGKTPSKVMINGRPIPKATGPLSESAQRRSCGVSA